MISIIQLFLFSLLAIIFFFLAGTVFTHILYKNTVKNYLYSNIYLQIFIGIIFVSIFSVIINFIYPLDRKINSIIFIVILIIGFYFFSSELKKNNFLKFGLIAFISTILLYKSKLFLPDAGLYHLPFIKIINSEKIIFGLSNLHFRFGHISIIQYSSGFLNNFIFLDNGITILPAILAGTFLIFLMNKIFFSKNIDINYLFIFFSFVFSIDYLDRYSNYGNDAPAFIFGILSIIFLIEYINSKKKESLFICSLLITFSFLIKPFFIILAVLPGYYFLINIFNRRVFEKKFLIIPVLIFLWTLKTLINSGCLIYPMKITCIKNLSWSDVNKTEFYEIAGEAASKGYLDIIKNKKSNISMDQFNKDFNWLDTWFQNHFMIILEKISPYILFLILFFTIAYLIKSKEYENTNLKKIYFINFSFFLFCIYWFLKFPLYRYGIFFIFVFLTLSAMILFKKYLFKEKLLKINKIIVCVFLIVLVSINFKRIINNNSNPVWPQIYNNNSKNYEKNFEGNTFIYTISKYSCMYDENLCSNWETNFYKFNNVKGYKFFISKH